MKRLLSLRAGRLPQRRLFSDAVSPVKPAAVPKTDRERHFLHALQVFHQLEGHFTVPGDFVVPSPAADADADAFPWPEETWGMELGHRLRLFTRGRCSPFKCALLHTIGFPYEDWRTYVWEQQIIPALKVYQELEGHLFVRQLFQVPMGDERWPRAAWGTRLGSQCQLLRRDVDDGLAMERKKQLDEMGFVWSDAQWKWKMQFLATLERYKELYGHTNVHHTFKIPNEDEFWPEVSWGYRLGTAVAKVKSNSEEQALTPRSMQDLRELDFFDNELALTVWREALMPSLELYPSIYDGDTLIPADFTVPSEAPWPERAWGMMLGYIVQTINTKLIFRAEMHDDKQRLKEIGYSWEPLFGKWAKEFLPALRLYKSKYGHCDVPSWWVVPSTDESWPKSLRGYQLELEALNFKFNAFESMFVDRTGSSNDNHANDDGDDSEEEGLDDWDDSDDSDDSDEEDLDDDADSD
ncbi:hypothetical protein PHYBOEH_001878 [Phytophthora boehmeriae]|uniref:Helicase-associated domain-containing protein n=1 Tax=Phytophthora boehmeriae TaxID=109152 RepID=A0A8T1WYV1_9STRA|nr:hypothetical protein PHYBOEH_001878 [Phytophthora boehmeriae]